MQTYLQTRFSETFKEKRGSGKIALRRAQFKLAEKNANMGLWCINGQRAVRIADKQYGRLIWEYRGGQLAVDVDETALRHNEDGTVSIPEREQRLFRAHVPPSGVTTGPFYNIFAPTLEYLDRLPEEAEVAVENMKLDAKIYRAAGRAPPLKLSPAALQVLQAGIYKTHGSLQNITMTTAVSSQQAYIQAAAKAEMQVTSGAFDYATAIKNAVKQAAREGVTVMYLSGHMDKLDVAVRRAVLTGANQTAAAISLAYADDMQCDLVETSAHAGARPSHAVWQGKVFSRSGQHRKYPAFVSSTGYGTGPGLCAHAGSTEKITCGLSCPNRPCQTGMARTGRRGWT